MSTIIYSTDPGATLQRLCKVWGITPANGQHAWGEIEGEGQAAKITAFGVRNPGTNRAYTIMTREEHLRRKLMERD